MSEKYLPSVGESIQFATGSSKIEGEHSPEAIRDHLQAWEYARSWGTSTSLDKILKCHKILQQNLRPDIAGKLRTVDVRVGTRRCPDPSSVPYLLEEWINKYSDPKVFEKEIDVDGAIRMAHVEFEEIHPFEDGNGRVGRCILNWHSIMNNMPLFIVEPGEKQMQYYEWFK